MAAACLDNRRRYGPLFVPRAEEELLALLLHCLLDKGVVEPAYQARLAELACAIADDQALGAHVTRCFPPSLAWPQIKQAILRGEWDALLKARRAVMAQLAGRDPVGTRWRRVIRPALRFLDRRTRALRSRGFSVALLAPDGAGKTTLARALGQTFYLPTRYIYMGTNLESSTITLPTTRWLRKLERRRRHPFVRMLGALNTLLEQGVRYRVAAYHRRRGRLVVFDRYTASALTTGQRSGALHKRLQRWVMGKLCPPPDVVIYLDAPAEVLYERKQEHSPAVLEQQRQRYLQLLQDVARKAIVDVRSGPDEVRRQVAGLIWCRYAADQQGR
jgi:thymidylate kinase